MAQEYKRIRECAYIGIEDTEKMTGEVPLLYVVPENGSRWNEKDFIMFLDKRLEEHELLKKVLFIDEIPKNYVGKTDRKSLRAKYEEKGGILDQSSNFDDSFQTQYQKVYQSGN